MQVIHKYTLEKRLWQVLQIPAGAEVVHVGAQHDRIQIWAIVDNKRPIQSRGFTVIMTGFDVPFDSEYLGTVLLHNGTTVLHVFQEAQ